jgi:hypothetical protein
MMLFVGVQYGLMAAVFFAGGIGSIQCRNWARILMLVVSGLWLAFGLLTTVIMAFVVPTVMRQQAIEHYPGLEHTILAVMIAVTAFLGIIMPAGFLFFYTRPSVRATCLAPINDRAAAAAAGETLPVPVAILGALYALGSLSVLALLFIKPVAILFGVVLHGLPGAAVYLTYFIFMGYASWMIFRRELIGWQLALGITLFGMVSALVSYFRQPDITKLLDEMEFLGPTPPIYKQFPHFASMVWLGTLVMLVAYLAFIWYTRRYFLFRNDRDRLNLEQGPVSQTGLDQR